MKRILGVSAVVALVTMTWAGVAPAGSICGTVYDEETSRPMEDVGVFVLDASGQDTGLSAATDAKGEFCIDELAVGTVHLRVEVDDYLTRNVRDVEVTEDPTEIWIGAGRSQVSMNPPWPNPGSSRVSFAYELASSAEVRLAVYDARGRLIRDWTGEPEAGSHEREWDFRDLAGTEVASGLYFIRLETPEVTVMRPLLRMR